MSILEHRKQPSESPAEDRAPSVWLPDRRNAEIRTYRGRSLEQLLPKIRRDLGPDAVVLREREGLMGGVGGFFATRFVEVEARAGASIDVYDEDDDEELELPAAPELAALPAPSEFSTQLQEAVAAWTAAKETGEPDPAASAAAPTATPQPAGDAPPTREPASAAPAVPEPVPELAVRELAVRELAVPEPAVPEPAVPELAVPEPALTEPAVIEPALAKEPAVIEPALAEPASISRRVMPQPIAVRPVRAPRRKLPRQAAAPHPVDSTAAARILGELIALGVSDGFARELLAAAAAHGGVVAGGLRAAVRAELSRRLTGAPSLPAHGGMVAFVGTGGSGKSLAAAALAAAYRHGSSLPVSVASLCETPDQRRLAETLSGDGVPVTRVPVTGARGASATLRQLAAQRETGLVIVDTPTANLTDTAGLTELGQRLDAIGPDAVYLVLSATLGAASARRALAQLASLGACAIVISHADETDQVGVLIELAAGRGLPVAYLTAGAEHRRSLIGTDPAALAQLLLLASKDTAGSKPSKQPKRTRGRTARDDAGSVPSFSITGHPRAKAGVRQIKAWTGLIGFGLALILSLGAGVPITIAAERALVAGVSGYLIAWGCAVAVWRALIAAELHAQVDAIKARREQATAAGK